MAYDRLSEAEEQAGRAVVDSAMAVHLALGAGLLESIYETCFCHELVKRGHTFRRQVSVPVVYDGIVFQEGLRLDVLVDDLVVCELKAAETMNPVYQAQLMSQLRLTEKPLGFLINFNVPLMRQGIKRVIL